MSTRVFYSMTISKKQTPHKNPQIKTLIGHTGEHNFGCAAGREDGEKAHLNLLAFRRTMHRMPTRRGSSPTAHLESEPRHQTCLAPSPARLLQPHHHQHTFNLHHHQHTFNFIMCGAPPPPSCSIWASPSLCASAPPPTIEFTRISTSELAPCITIPDL